jgi:peptidoglycan glycosyltransferase
VNPQIRKLFVFLCVLFVAVVATTTYWLWRSPDLEARRGNPNLVVRQLTIERGVVYASDGRTVLARNRVRKVQGRTWYLRTYPQNELAAHVVGYSTLARSRAGLEKSLNDFLTGSNSNLKTVLDRTVDKLRGLTQEGNDLVLTIDAEAQRAALEALEGSCGAAVALDPTTGAVLVMASSPSYDPNLVENRFRQIIRAPGPCDPAAPLLNRATQGLFIPGSTFKVVTAAAALESGRYTPDTRFDDPGYCVEYGKKVFNFADQSGPEAFGNVTFAEALQHSINAVFCEVGKGLGPLAVLEQAERFGFYDVPPLETPEDERRASGLYERGRLFFPADPNAVDPGRLAFGQERMLVTPLQMAMVAAGIANGGVVMEPYVVDRVLAPDGDILTKTSPDELSEAVSPQTAADLAAMMELVVQSGTGTAAQIPGVRVGGKTGTAETGRPGENDTWFLAFAPAGAPRVAVAVALSGKAGTGGATAAPIARTIMQALLGQSA